MKVGGAFFKILFTSAALAAMIASSLSSHASVSRMIYVMGRNGKGRIARFLSYIHPHCLTPTHAVLVVGAVSLLAVQFTLEFISSMINFGALIAFTVVNLTVIVFFAYPAEGTAHAQGDFQEHRVAVHRHVPHRRALDKPALRRPVVRRYLAHVGIVLLLCMTRGFRAPLTMRIEEETLAEEGTPVPHIKHGAE